MGSLKPADGAACSAANHPIDSSMIEALPGKPPLDFHDDRTVGRALIALAVSIVCRTLVARVIAIIRRRIVAIVRVWIGRGEAERKPKREAGVKEEGVPETEAIVKIVEPKPV